MAQLSDAIQEKVKVEEDSSDEEMEALKRIPEFWLIVFKNVDVLSDMIQERDEPILKHLQDVNVKLSDPGQPTSFNQVFNFEPNEYFRNEVVTKAYQMQLQPYDLDFFFFNEPEVTGCTGRQINWKKGKNVTLKTIKTKPKHKGRNTGRTVTKTIPNDYFLNFSSPPKVPEHGEFDDGSAARLDVDFEIGHLREHIPHAMSYFTGETIADDDGYYNDNYDDHDEESEDSDDELEEDDYEMLFSWFGGSDEVTTRGTQSAQDNNKCESPKMVCAQAYHHTAAGTESGY
ncbi:nucleosome assembly protein 1-like 1-A [Scyliorhinus torazame]|uniref:nucleosome assembly protein 1-like 1-A n=1 Tax=Scyliorhinus torazame TaxID=75743 RepID=UPI003B5A296F